MPAGRLPSSPSVFTADEYRAWLQRTPSTSAIYERIRANRDAALAHQRASRLTFSAENLNLLDRAREVRDCWLGTVRLAYLPGGFLYPVCCASRRDRRTTATARR